MHSDSDCHFSSRASGRVFGGGVADFGAWSIVQDETYADLHKSWHRNEPHAPMSFFQLLESVSDVHNRPWRALKIFQGSCD
eukprot:3974442-Amphidinium_carterae.1